MKLGIMQPYFFPYLGYFQLIYVVDTFVVYDNIEYTKKGWINRNRYLCNGSAKYFTIPIAKDSDYLMVCQRKIADSFNRRQLKNQIQMAYKKAPFFSDVFPLFCDCVDNPNENLFEFIHYSLINLLAYMDIKTNIVISSSLDIDYKLKGKEKVMEICRKFSATTYINPIGGLSLYDKTEFKQERVELNFIRMNDNIYYPQFQNDFISGLSILDVLMFNSKDVVKELLHCYTLV